MMAKYRSKLPQLSGDLFLTDGGVETTLIYREGLDLQYFAAFPLLDDPNGQEVLRKYFDSYCQIAIANNVGFILEAVTWRANVDWATKLNYSKENLEKVLQKAVEMLVPLRDRYENEKSKIVISGCIGPRGDAYVPEEQMTALESEIYHSHQIETFSKTDADMVTALTLNYVEEAIGIASAAKSFDMPSVISFTVETDGRLPTGQTLKDAIEQVEYETDHAPAYYKINCAHPTHFADVVSSGEPWLKKIRSIRANASSCSHAELEEADVLDEGNPIELGAQYRELMAKLPNLNILGGCCGTDHRHIKEICKSCIS